MSQPPPPPFSVRVDAVDDAAWVRPIGELDLMTSRELDARLHAVRAQGSERLVLDLREASFIDSQGMSVIVTWSERSAGERFGFAVVAGPPAVQRTFEITGLNHVLRFVEGD